MMRRTTSILSIVLGLCCFSIAACTCDVEIVTEQLPDGKVGVYYVTTIDADCDIGEWELVSGDLPPGLSFSRTGRLSGTPTLAGIYTLTIGVTGEAEGFTSRGYSLFVQKASSCAVQVTSIDFDSVTVSSSRDTTFTITNSGGGTLNGTVSISTAVPCEDFSISVGLGAYSLAEGESHTVTVNFAPTSAGPKTCRFETGNNLCSDVNVTGTGK
jgi:hypothetical protein